MAFLLDLHEFLPETAWLFVWICLTSLVLSGTAWLCVRICSAVPVRLGATISRC